MNLRQLECFLTLSEELNYHRAANRLFISQPSLSTQIQNLQKDVGTALFKKVGRHIELTEAGQLLSVRAKEILMQVRATENEIQSFYKNDRSLIKIGLSGNHLIAPILKKFKKEHPHTLISVREYSTPNTIKKIINREIEFGIIFSSIKNPSIEYIPLFTEELVAVITVSNPLNDLSSITLLEIQSSPLVVLNPNFYVRNILDSAFQDEMANPNYVLEVTTYQNCLNAIRLMNGITFVPKSFFRTIKNLGLANDLVSLKIDGNFVQQPVGIASRIDYPFDKTTKDLVNAVKLFYHPV